MNIGCKYIALLKTLFIYCKIILVEIVLYIKIKKKGARKTFEEEKTMKASS